VTASDRDAFGADLGVFFAPHHRETYGWEGAPSTTQSPSRTCDLVVEGVSMLGEVCAARSRE
jgi:hypothetical protein